MSKPRPTAMTIVIVGTLTEDAPIGEELSAFIEAVTKAMEQTFPSMKLAYPPMTVNLHELRDDWHGWTKRAAEEEKQ